MRFRYAAIEREYGCGARLIGARLQELTGIPCYNEEIPEEAGKAMHLNREEVLDLEAQSMRSLLFTVAMLGKITGGQTASLPDRLVELYAREHEVIQQLANRGPAVFIGRCADEALRDRGNVLRVFIRCEQKDKIRRAMQEYGLGEQEVLTTMTRVDRRRSDYYYANTGHDWKDLSRYDLVLNSTVLGTEGCAQVLAGALVNLHEEE